MKSNPNILCSALSIALLSAIAAALPLAAFAETFTEGKQVPPTDRETESRRLCLGAGACADWAGADRGQQAGADGLRLSQWHPHRAQQREHGAARASHAGRRVRHSRKGKGSRLDDLQRRGDAVDGAADVDGHRDARGRSAGLSGLARLRAAAAGVFQAALHRDDARAARSSSPMKLPRRARPCIRG